MRQDALELLLTTLEVRLSAFAVCEIGRGWRLQPSAMDSVVLHFVLKGEGCIQTEGERITLASNMIVVTPAHSVKSIAGPGEVVRETTTAENCTLLTNGLLCFRAREDQADLVLACASLSASYMGCYGLFDCVTEPIAATVEGNELFRTSFAALLEELARPDLGTMVIAESLMRQALILLLRNHVHRVGADSPFLLPLGDPRLVRAVSAVLTHPEQPHSVASLSAIAGMSRSSFVARFTEAYGRTPGEFVHSVRMRSAVRLLSTSEMPIKALAAAVGYASRSHFSRLFKESYGIDPSSYRNNGQGQPPEQDQIPPTHDENDCDVTRNLMTIPLVQ